MSWYHRLFDQYEQWHTRNAAWLQYDAPSRNGGVGLVTAKNFFAQVKTEAEQVDRKNMAAHITASAFLLNAEGDSLLCVQKARYPMGLLQPGSQFYDNCPRDPLDLAIRAVQTDAGIEISRRDV